MKKYDFYIAVIKSLGACDLYNRYCTTFTDAVKSKTRKASWFIMHYFGRNTLQFYNDLFHTFRDNNFSFNGVDLNVFHIAKTKWC